MQKALLSIVAAVAAVALPGVPASAQVPIPASIGQIVARPAEYAGKHVSVTGTVLVRGEALWLQLCDEAMTCLYLDHADRVRDSAGQRMTLSGTFLAHATLRFTPVDNVLVLDPAGS
jgi:hypothetical protein